MTLHCNIYVPGVVFIAPLHSNAIALFTFKCNALVNSIKAGQPFSFAYFAMAGKSELEETILLLEV